MQGRRPAVVAFALAVAGVLFALLLAQPLLLLIPVGIGGSLIARQYQFVRDIEQTRASLSVTQSLATRQVRANQATTLTIETSTRSLPPLDIDLNPQPPAALATDTDPITIVAGDDAQMYVLESQVAGRYEIPPPELRIVSRDGRFETTLALGNTVNLVVTPAGPQEIHVGEGGERFAAAYGEHPAGKGGAGLDPSELRKYLPGDPTNRIDWKATARLNEPHVREFEAETDRETLLILDTRSTMRTGPEHETKLDYARQLALAFVDSADSLGDPLGLVAFDDTGITDTQPADATPNHYRSLRTTLQDLTPEPSTDTAQSRDLSGPDTAYRAATHLRNDTSPYAATLRPYFSTHGAYVQRLGDRPLFATVRGQLARTNARTWTIIITDDFQPTETREAVKLARRQGGHVLVCLLPSILYEPGGLADLDDAYANYRDFEEFRRSLADVEGVRALEVGPRDRLAAVLAHNQPPRGTNP